MEWRIQGRNVEINDQIRGHIEEKLGQLSKHLPGVSTVSVELSAESTRSQRDRFVAQVTLDVGGSILRAEQRGANTKTAINSAAEILSRRIERYKSHAYRSERSRLTGRSANQETEEAYAVTGWADEGPTAGLEATDGGFADGAVVRVKEFEMEPMSVDEAAVQMEFLGHSFYMFLDSESDKHGVLYLRGDGNYGLIQPKSA